MSALPPQLIGSALQGTVQQRQAQQLRSVSERQQSDMSQTVVRTGEQHESLIENTDADSGVDSESGGGAGGQGRAFKEQPQPASPDGTESGNQSGITSDGDGHMHLDITA